MYHGSICNIQGNMDLISSVIRALSNERVLGSIPGPTIHLLISNITRQLIINVSIYQSRLVYFTGCLRLIFSCFVLVNIAPDLDTCRLGVQNSGGEVRNSTSLGPCLQARANYMKFQPANLSFEFTFSSTVHVSTSKPNHIAEFQFGLVNSSILLFKRNVTGNYTIARLYNYLLFIQNVDYN